MTLPIRGSGRIRLFAGAALAAVLLTATATGTAVGQPVRHTANQLGISMQTQQYDEWCWVASGDTIASYLGHGTDQNSFCDLAHGQSTQTQCANEPGYLSYDQTAFSSLGLSPGSESGAIPFATIVSNIDANHPMETGISWTAGGGHAEVIYGYDSSSQNIYWGDPWPSDTRYNEAAYSYYTSNGTFYWDDTLYNIGA